MSAKKKPIARKPRPPAHRLLFKPEERMPLAALKHLKKQPVKKAGPADGGPAFPCVYGHPAGMTLRDYFAAATLVNYELIGGHIGDWPKTFARNAYKLADAMLLERGDA